MPAKSNQVAVETNIKRKYPHLPEWQEKHLIGLAEKHRKEKVIRKCVHCGIDFIARGWKGYEPKFCSKGCHNLYMTANPLSGQDHPRWNGGKRLDKQGYIVVTHNKKAVREHVLIAEKILGRKLKMGEQVHHINANRGDNRNNNLLICNCGFHQWIHWSMSKKYQEEHFAQ